MNEERFDELTKGLAAGRFSRGQVMKMVGGALLGSAFGHLGLALGAGDAEARRRKKRPPPLTCPTEIKCSSVITSNTDFKIWDGGCGTFFDPNGIWKAVCDKDNRDPAFSQLRKYLFSRGFRDYGEPEGFVIEDANFTHYEEVLILRLYKQTTGEEAIIRYGMDDFDNPSTYAVVSKVEEIPNYVLHVGDQGTVERLQASFAQTSSAVATANDNSQVGTSDLGDVTFAGFVCDNDLCTSSCQLVMAGLALTGGAGVGVVYFIRGALSAKVILGALVKTVEIGLGIGNVSCSFWCKGLAEKAVKEDDEQNCGACDNVCAAGFERCCDGQCKNIKTDNAHCGACNFACVGRRGTTCCQGNCYKDCPEGQQRDAQTCTCKTCKPPDLHDSNNRCSDKSDCCSPAVCAVHPDWQIKEHTCCLAGGQPCRNDSECCAAWCTDQGVCADCNTEGARGGNGLPYDCPVTQYCNDNGKCAPCRHEFDSCQFDEECCGSMACLGGICRDE